MFASVKKGLAEFREFAFKGNMIDLAIAVVIGAAFSGVITSLVNDIIMPSVSYVVTAASTASNAAKHMAGEAPPTPPPTPATQPGQTAPAPVAAPPAPPAAKPDPNKTVDLDWKIGRIEIGHFIAALINFTIVAFAVFIIMVKLLGNMIKKVNKAPAPSAPTMKQCPYCLSDIPIKARKCGHCTSDLPTTA